LPEHLALVAADEGLTVQLTPLSRSSEGLAVLSKSTREIHVGELRNGAGAYEFDYIVHAVRKGYENFAVVRDKTTRPQESEYQDYNAPAVSSEALPGASTQKILQEKVSDLEDTRPNKKDAK
jgi:hypothetical protein